MLFLTDDSAVYEDATGVYEPEMCVAQSSDGHVRVFRFTLERLHRIVNDERVYYVTTCIAKGFHAGTLPYPIHTYKEWYLKSLGSVASYVDSTPSDLLDALCSADPVTRSEVYRAIGEYHGFENLDGYPEEMTRKQWERSRNA